MGFDYQWTCPIIDKNIDNARDIIKDFLESTIEEFCPMINRNDLYKFSKQYADMLFSNLESCFESTRESNQDMRKAADLQISDLESEIADLKDQIADLEDKISNFEKQIHND